MRGGFWARELAAQAGVSYKMTEDIRASDASRSREHVLSGRGLVVAVVQAGDEGLGAPDAVRKPKGPRTTTVFPASVQRFIAAYVSSAIQTAEGTRSTFQRDPPSGTSVTTSAQNPFSSRYMHKAE